MVVQACNPNPQKVEAKVESQEFKVIIQYVVSSGAAYLKTKPKHRKKRQHYLAYTYRKGCGLFKYH